MKPDKVGGHPACSHWDQLAWYTEVMVFTDLHLPLSAFQLSSAMAHAAIISAALPCRPSPSHSWDGIHGRQQGAGCAVQENNSAFPLFWATARLYRPGYSRLLNSGACQRRHDINAAQTGPTASASDLNATPESKVELQSRRQLLLFAGGLAALVSQSSGEGHAVVAAPRIDFSKAPTHPFDPADQRLRQAATLFQQALSATTVEEEERLWTQVIDRYGKLDAEWVSDIVSRAWGNRGNARSRQGKMEQALEDFDRSIELAPYAADPILNRGVTLESLGRYAEAATDYQAVLDAQPNDPAAWNNLGNVKAALRQWDEALIDYRRAVQIAPEFSFAAANYALALYQVGRENEAFKQFRSLLRKYPEFPDVRAALAVALYAQGLTAEAEANWGRVEDGRYRDRNWVQYTRKWPPRLVNALEGFLDVKSVAAS